MNIVRINSKNVFFIIFALISNTIREANTGYEGMLSSAYTNVTPANSNKKDDNFGTCSVGKLCSELGGNCLKCDINPNCVYGSTYSINCTAPDVIDCLGDRSFTKQYICRYCYQTENWEHKCHLKNSCSSVASPLQYYRTNCTVNNDIICLGRRKFMKNLRCNWTGGYRWSTALILSITLGGFGADRFYLGHWQEGIGKLFSFGGLGVWTLIDVMLISMRYLGPADGSLYI
ncbi:TM2 domain-containing protein almondex [Chelonus insularis]|uniref:TM2 domain-containing protein almondex n=1 Tax=Chelonus insularis TaxID=460826 RepID=UPI001589B465|nr:TM2 domain-containing protein almondex [Chelonus insularis]